MAKYADNLLQVCFYLYKIAKTVTWSRDQAVHCQLHATHLFQSKVQLKVKNMNQLIEQCTCDVIFYQFWLSLLWHLSLSYVLHTLSVTTTHPPFFFLADWHIMLSEIMASYTSLYLSCHFKSAKKPCYPCLSHMYWNLCFVTNIYGSSSSLWMPHTDRGPPITMSFIPLWIILIFDWHRTAPTTSRRAGSYVLGLRVSNIKLWADKFHAWIILHPDGPCSIQVFGLTHCQLFLFHIFINFIT